MPARRSIDFDQDDSWTLFHSCGFDFSVWEIFGALLFGGRLVIVPRDVAASPREFRRLLAEEGVTVLSQIPSAFARLLEPEGDVAWAARLRYVVFGGEALDYAALRPWYRRGYNAATRLVNMYGITETTVHVTYREVDAEDAESGGGPASGGRWRICTLYVLDERGRPQPIGVAGELYVGGDGLPGLLEPARA